MGILSSLFSKDKDPFAKDMVKVCAGQFRINITGWGTYQPSDKRKKPVADITVWGCMTGTITKEYQICKYVVTQKQWKLVMGEGFNPSTQKGDDLPVTDVSYDDIMKFIKKLNALTGKKYRLPSEAEWMWAAMGASKDKDEGKYAGCNDVKDLGKYAWISDNKIHPVGKKKCNELGLYDMSGNVCEMCEDMYNKRVVSKEDYIEKEGNNHVVKGRCFNRPEDGEIGYRDWGSGQVTSFRLAHNV